MTSNQTSPNDLDCDGFNPHQDIVAVLSFLMFPVALLLNGVAAWVSMHLKSTSTFMVYLKNLVAANIIMTLISPIDAASELRNRSKEVLIVSCYTSPIFYSTQYTSITLLGFISLDRFFKIMMPRSMLLAQNLTFSKLLSGLAWVILFGGTALPNIILSNQPVVNMTEFTSCMTLKGAAGLEFHERTVIYLNVYFWLISVVIVVCYICITNKVIQSFRNSGSSNNKGKHKVKLRVFLVVIVFFLSFGPYHIVRIPYTFQQVSSTYSSDCSYFAGRFAKEISLWVANTSICLNPLLYIFLCREFKEKLMSMIQNLSIFFRAAGKTKGDSPQCRY